MNKPLSYKTFPLWIIYVSNLHSISIYFLGAFIILQLGWPYMTAYLVFILVLEYRLLSKHCINCYYWGKTCGFGKGRISSWMFKQGESAKFCVKKMTWKDMIPDLLVSFIPFAIGFILLIVRFEIKLLLAIILLVGLSTFGSGLIRSSLTCKYCKQKELGCPAEQLFNKTKNDD